MQTSPKPQSTLLAALTLAATLAAPQTAMGVESRDRQGWNADDKRLQAKLEYPVEALGLPSDVTRALLSAKILHLRDLVALQKSDLLRIPRLGPTKLQPITTTLAKVELTLGMNPPPPTRTPGRKRTTARSPFAPSRTYEEFREQLVASVRSYAKTLPQAERLALLERHREDLVSHLDDHTLGNRRFDILMVQWVDIENRQSAAKLSAQMPARDGEVGIEPASVRAFEMSGLFRLAVALNLEAIRSGQPVGATWVQKTVSPERRVPSIHRALVGAILEQPVQLLRLGGRPDATPYDIATIGELIAWSQLGAGHRKQVQRAHEILSALDLTGTGLEKLPLGLDLAIRSWWKAPAKTATEDWIDSVGTNTTEQLRELPPKARYATLHELAKQFEKQIGPHRGSLFLAKLTRGHTKPQVGRQERPSIGKATVGRVLKQLEGKICRWLDRQSVITRAQSQLRRSNAFTGSHRRRE